eukprot:scaffold238161_cov22-Tisochrysis_lutea.AAC.2
MQAFRFTCLHLLLAKNLSCDCARHSQHLHCEHANGCSATSSRQMLACQHAAWGRGTWAKCMMA